MHDVCVYVCGCLWYREELCGVCSFLTPSGIGIRTQVTRLAWCFYSLSHSPGCAVFFQNDCHLSMTSEQLWFCCHPRHICRDETCWALGQAGSCSVCSLGSSASVVSPLLPLPQTLLLRCSLWGQARFGSHSSGQLFETQGNSSFKPLFLSVTWGSGVIAGFSVQAVYSLSETCRNRSVSDFEIFV